jgi:hypothetical protein
MIEALVHHHRTILRTFNRPFKRYFLSKHRLENRFSMISGSQADCIRPFTPACPVPASRN